MRRSPRQWIDAIEEYRKAYGPWMRMGERIVRRYRLEKDRAESSGRYSDRAEDTYNILWSNVETIGPDLFAKVPTVHAKRRHGDKDPMGRLAGQVIERMVSVENETNGFKDAFDAVVLDLLLPGRGVPWVRFKDDDRGRYVCIDYVHWQDFAHALERNWADVERRGWVARRQAMTREEGRKRFGSKFKDVKLTLDRRTTEERASNQRVEGSEKRYAEVWEIWDCDTRTRLFVADGSEKPLEEAPDPYRLRSFLPCPRPVFSTLTNEDLEPTPDYQQYVSQAEELDIITGRIRHLTEMLKLVGVYDGSAESIARLLKAPDGEMLKVDNMQALLAKGASTGGGLTGVVAFLPLKDIAETLRGLYEARERIKAVLYEVSGISDIVRGHVDPREKASQSALKAQNASRRLEKRRRKVERCARDTIRIMVELLLELQSSDILRAQSGFDQLPEIEQMDPIARMQAWTAVEQLLRHDKLRQFRVDVETDSTIAIDEEKTVEERTNFLTAAGQYLQSMLPIVQASPDLAAPMGQMLLFVIRGFRAGRTLEAEFTTAVDGINQRVQQMQQAEQQAAQQQAEGGSQPPPDPEAEAKAAQVQQQAQVDAQKAQVELQILRDKQAFEQQKQAMELQKMQMEIQAAAAVPPGVPGPEGGQ